MAKIQIRKIKSEAGFTLIEVLIAILVLILFSLVMLQGLVIAYVLKAKAQDTTEATKWIQQDLEKVRQRLSTFQKTSLAADANLSSTLITVIPVAGFAQNDTIKIGLDPQIYTISAPITTNAANTLTITINPALGSTQLQNATVTRTTNCKNNNDPNNGFAAVLLSQIPAIDPPNPQTSNFTGRQFTLTRTMTVSNKAPFNVNVLNLSYNVSPLPSGSSVAQLNTEVIPDAVFQCPPQ